MARERERGKKLTPLSSGGHEKSRGQQAADCRQGPRKAMDAQQSDLTLFPCLRNTCPQGSCPTSYVCMYEYLSLSNSVHFSSAFCSRSLAAPARTDSPTGHPAPNALSPFLSAPDGPSRCPVASVSPLADHAQPYAVFKTVEAPDVLVETGALVSAQREARP